MGEDDDADKVAPLGRFHSKTVCWRCGANGHVELIVVRATRAWGWACVDRVGCERRYYRQRQLDLFGAA